MTRPFAAGVLAVALTLPMHAAAQSGASELGAAVRDAIQRRDEGALRALIDPGASRAAGAPDAAVVTRTLAGWLAREFDGTATVTVQPPDQVKGYDPAQHALTGARFLQRFPVPPEAIVTIKQEDRRPNGIRVQQVQFGAVRRPEGWRVVLPALIARGQP